MTPADSVELLPVTQADVTDADKAAVTRFHATQIKRIMDGDSTLGEDGRQTIEQAFAERRLAGIAEGRRLSTATPVPATAEGVRDHVAGLIALAGLGTNTGEPRRPHGEWKPQEFTDRIMDIVPTRVVDQCFALADSILAVLTTRPTDTAAMVREAAQEMLIAFAEGVAWSDEQRSAYERLASLLAAPETTHD